VGIEQAQLLAAVHGIEGVIEIEHDPPRHLPEGRAVQVNELWRELGDDGGLKAAYRGGCRACQNLPKERYAYEHVYQRCPPSSA
jgi:hypothetical protein